MFYFCSYFCRHEFLANGLGASFAGKSEGIHG
jgi:YHS domain-containing protein